MMKMFKANQKNNNNLKKKFRKIMNLRTMKTIMKKNKNKYNYSNLPKNNKKKMIFAEYAMNR